jgi:hypothetical protein
MKKSVVIGLACAIALAAVETKNWRQDSMAAFDKGSITKLSLSSEGRLSLAPAVKEVFDPSVSFLWAVARDSKGNLYVGGGDLGGTKAKLFQVDSQGRVKALAEVDGVAIQALAIDKSDRIYAATSPDGKVFRIDAAGKVQEFYDPKTKYIWALAFDAAGNLFVATGDQGEIHRVTPAGVGSVFFKTEETHARSLAVDAAGNLIVGTDASGLILRVTPAGQGFVVYQSPKREITAVAVAADGSIYASAVGNKNAPATPPPNSNAQAPGITPNAARPGVLPVASPLPVVAGGSVVYRIQTDGYPRKIWSDSQELVYAIAFDARGNPILGTGNHGALYRLDSDHAYTRLTNLPSTQITGLLTAPDGTLFAVTGNIGKLFAVGPALESSGAYESDVLDADEFSYWGRINFTPEAASGIEFETRSGNLDRPQQNWSLWQKLNAGRIVSPSARFLQYRATLTGKADLDSIDVAYQMKNVAPVIETLETTPDNYKFPAGANTAPPASAILNLPALGKRPAAASATALTSPANTPSMTWSKGQVGARWQASDDNGDSLVYRVEIRGVNETGWKLVRDKVYENYLSWDSTAFPDGKYVIRVTASDSPSNPPDQALSSSRESDPFTIDNTPPVVTCCTVTGSSVTFAAKDALGVLGKAEYSLNGGDWIVVQPTTGLTDSSEHQYKIDLPSRQGETTVAVRVSDEFENQAVAKTVLR